MSTQPTPLTIEGVLGLIREASREFREEQEQASRKFREEQEQSSRKFREEQEQSSREFREEQEQSNRDFNQKFDKMVADADRRQAEAEKRQAETDRKFQETAEQIKQTNKDVGGLTSSIGAMVANMVKGNIVEKFQALGYNDLDKCYEKLKFNNKKLGIKGEIDLILENGDVAILIEVKTTLETADVRRHIGRLDKFRRCVDAKGTDKRRFVGAVAGAVIEGDAAEVALENGLYVIVQSGEAFEILPQPEGFVAKEW